MNLRHLLIVGVLAGMTAGAMGRDRQDFNLNWKFHKGDASAAEAADFDDSKWRTLDLPHDWSIEHKFHGKAAGGMRGGYVVLGKGWYRKTFNAPSDNKDQKVYIEFGGIYKNSTVWINGTELGKRWYGYSTFQYDLTPHIKWGADNVISVKVDTPKQTCRWFSGAGIYRNVWLTYTDKLAVDHWGSYVSTPEVSAKSALVKVRTDVVNAHKKAKTCTIITTLLNSKGKKVADAKAESEIPAGKTHRFEQEFKVKKPALWSADEPILYNAKSEIKAGRKVVDEYSTEFGIRTTDWAVGKGFIINGKPVSLNGINIHHDLGGLGAAFNTRAMERRLELLKKMGCNALRMAHNPPASEVLDLCDRMGFYVIDEAFDKWGTDRYATFEADWPKDLEAMILRDRNHASVVLWSLGNENWHVRYPKSKDIYEKMTTLARKHDDTRKFTFACSPGKFINEARTMDVASLNYHEALLDDYKKALPEKVIIISESYSYWSGKDGKAQAYQPLNPWIIGKKDPHVAGTFIWTGIEYLGEAKAKWPQHGWNAAPIDTCAIMKPVAYLHESFWSDKPMVHIAILSDKISSPRFSAKHWGWPNMVSHWTLPKLKGQNVKITTFSNCEEVELIVNGKSQGKKKLADFENRMISWEGIPYKEGKVTAIGFKGGKKVCEHEIKTAGAAKKIVLAPDRDVIDANGRDLSHVMAIIVDENGVVVPGAKHVIKFEAAGAGKVRAVDNGDLTCEISHKETSRPAYNGRCMAIVQSSRESGNITVKVTAEGLESAEVIIKSK